MNTESRPPLLAVDIGNSKIKFGLFTNLAENEFPEPAYVCSVPTRDEVSIELLQHLPDRVDWHVVSVQREAELQLEEWVYFYRRGDAWRKLSRNDLGLSVQVDYPDRVGMDRLAAAVAVNQLRRPDQAAVAIGAGSAMTIDLISPDGAFQGGAILAGFRMCAEALATAADLLPLALLEPTAEPPSLPGKNTEAAIRAGLFWGAVGAAREIVSQYARQHPELQVYVSGGDLERLAPLLDARVQFVPHLVLRGIACAARNYWST